MKRGTFKRRPPSSLKRTLRKSAGGMRRGSEPVLVFELSGKIPSKKNAWRQNGRGGVFIDRELKSRLDVLTYELISIKNKHRLKSPLEGSVRVEAFFSVKSLKCDLDNAYTTLQDLLQASGILKNDKDVYDIIATREIAEEDKVLVSIYHDE